MRYFVSYIYVTLDDSVGVGNCEVIFPQEGPTLEDIRIFELKFVKESISEGIVRVTVINYIPLSKG